jgi:hypothetical protein
MGEGWEREWQWEEGSVCGALCCAVLLGGASEVWLFGGMGGGGEGCRSRERVGVVAVVVVVGGQKRHEWAPRARRDETREEASDRVRLREEKEMAGACTSMEHEHEHEHEQQSRRPGAHPFSLPAAPR